MFPLIVALYTNSEKLLYIIKVLKFDFFFILVKLKNKHLYSIYKKKGRFSHEIKSINTNLCGIC